MLTDARIFDNRGRAKTQNQEQSTMSAPILIASQRSYSPTAAHFCCFDELRVDET